MKLSFVSLPNMQKQGLKRSTMHAQASWTLDGKLEHLLLPQDTRQEREYILDLKLKVDVFEADFEEVLEVLTIEDDAQT